MAEYDFLLRHVIDAQGVLDASTGGDVDLDDIREILGHAGALASEVIEPLNTVGDRSGNTLTDGRVATAPGFPEAYRAYAEGGWVGIGLPREAGGDGMPAVVTAAVNEIWSAANIAFSLGPGLSVGAAYAVFASASKDLKELYLPPLVSGRWTGTMNLTEPQSGTDLAGIRTLARPRPDGTWGVNGQKIFITWGDHDLTENIVHLVLSRTEGAPDGLGGLSLFVVPKYLPLSDGSPGERNSVHTVSVEHKLGIHASPTCVLDYEDATGWLIGDLHRGLQAMFVMMNVARFGVATQGLGVADRAYQRAAAYAAERVQGRVEGRPLGTPIAEHPDVRRLLLSMRSTISAMRVFQLQVAAWLDLARAHQDAEAFALADFFVPILKGWITENAVQIANDGIQVHGGTGFIEETGAAQHLRDARILPIYEGTTAIQANDLTRRKLVRNNGTTAQAAYALVETAVQSLARHDHPVAQHTVHRLQAALASAREATAALLEQAEDNPRDTLASGVPYLTQWGLLAGGWMHARIVAAALDTPENPDTARRLMEADFYGAHHLSLIPSLTEAIRAGEIV
ncbi:MULTISPECIES: acyl-CoA dehydrogenase [unclassified Streptomyces]|uniref:acyl-CoA dehydrogenase n=1 Tax=unclassified Streptomyces TaxID=2593676 RepID=UPI0021AC0714|nr:acyl-CoA dehydrogenase [Streptomyces sp. KhCrAH-43]